MVSVQSGRRYALVPGTVTPSPEQAQRILERSIERPLDQLPTDQTNERTPEEHAVRNWFSNALSKDHGSQEVRAAPPRLSTNETPGFGGNRLASRDKVRRRSSLRTWKAHQASSGNRRDKKRKHTTSIQDRGRRHSRDISEDVPHMSELDSDDGIKPTYKDVFDSRVHHDSRREVWPAHSRNAVHSLTEQAPAN
ncbi:hypothetical protein MMC08_006010 [Hypocenomyce scalaris]|nr:hypothetical protein [Hypocenomyce scalaris]